MSTILDALKKSEQERKLSAVPTLQDLPVPEEPARWPLWIALASLVLLLFIIAILVWQRQAPDPQSSELVIDTQTVENLAQTVAEEGIVVNVVSYSEQPEQRFVMINGKLFREQEFVRAGLKVVQINQDNVVLNERGKRLVRKP